ncbi:universal stress protein [Streptomyces sp. NPDC048650]|uniref:universal stress protein n=1 Tax=unclassified Streptomyces TaxID=2593676 RepID=UPI003717F937
MGTREVMEAMEHPLVVGVDGTDAALRAVDWATDEAARRGLPLRIVHASRWERYEGTAPADDPERPGEQILAEDAVGCAAERVRSRAADVAVAAEVVADDPVTALLDAGHYASMLVLGTSGRGEIAGLLLGSVGLAIAARARCPVIVVRGGSPAAVGSGGRVLLGVDDPARASEAVRFAFREAEIRHGTLEAVRAWRRPASYRASNRPLPAEAARRSQEEQAAALLDDALGEVVADHPGVQVCRATVAGRPHKVLLRRSGSADLLVLGAVHRHGHHPGLQVGRVARTALCHASCPVAVVAQQA